MLLVWWKLLGLLLVNVFSRVWVWLGFLSVNVGLFLSVCMCLSVCLFGICVCMVNYLFSVSGLFVW